MVDMQYMFYLLPLLQVRRSRGISLYTNWAIMWYITWNGCTNKLRICRHCTLVWLNMVVRGGLRVTLTQPGSCWIWSLVISDLGKTWRHYGFTMDSFWRHTSGGSLKLKCKQCGEHSAKCVLGKSNLVWAKPLTINIGWALLPDWCGMG